MLYFSVLQVSDKFQVRTTGPVDPKTRQPVKGRKRHGGIRLGEMERDSLLAHGVSFLLQDRLMNCSDASYVCAYMGCRCLLTLLVDYLFGKESYATHLAQHRVPSDGEEVTCGPNLGTA